MLHATNLVGFGSSLSGDPTYVSSIQTFGLAGSTKAVSLSPLGLQPGDLIIVAGANDYTWDVPFVTTSGYTLIDSVQSGADKGFAAYYLVVTGTPPTFVGLSSGPYNYAVNIAVYRYIDPITPIHVKGTIVGSTVYVPSPGPITTTIPRTLAVIFGAQEDGISTTSTPPSGYITNGHSHESAGAGQSTCAMASKFLAASGTENPGFFMFSQFGDSYALTIALTPLNR